MPDYDDPRQATEDTLDVFEEADTSTDGPERDPNAIRRPGRPQGDPDTRPVDEKIDTTEHTPEGLDLGKTELSGQDLSRRMTGAGMIGIAPDGADAKRTEDPRGVERPNVGDGPPTRRKDRAERDEHGRHTGQITPVDADDVDRPDGSPATSGRFNTKFDAQSGTTTNERPIPGGREIKTVTKDSDGKVVDAHTISVTRDGNNIVLTDFDELTGTTGTTVTDNRDNTGYTTVRGADGQRVDDDSVLLQPLVQPKDNKKTDGGTKTPYEDPTMSTGTPQLANELISERARAELEADPEGDGRGARGPEVTPQNKEKPADAYSETPLVKDDELVNPVNPAVEQELAPPGSGELTVGHLDLVSDPPQAGAASHELDSGTGPTAPTASPGPAGTQSFLVPTEVGAVQEDPPFAPTQPEAPDLVAAAAPDAPAPQVGPGPAAAQPGDFAAPAPGEEPEGAVFEDVHRDGEEPGFNDDAI
jgi:hypothetical protein